MFPHPLVLLKAGQYQRDGAGHVVTDDAGWPVEVDEAPVIRFRGNLQPAPLPKRIRNTARLGGEDDSGEAFSSHLLFAPMSVTIHQRDRVRRDPDDGVVYLVAADAQDAAGRGHHLEVDLVEFRLGAAAP